MKMTPIRSLFLFLMCSTSLLMMQSCDIESPKFTWNAEAQAVDMDSTWNSNFDIQFILSEFNLVESSPIIYLDTIRFKMFGSLPGQGEINSGCKPKLKINGTQATFVSMTPSNVQVEDNMEFDLELKFAFDHLVLPMDREIDGGICILLETLDPVNDPSPTLEDVYQVRIDYSMEPGEDSQKMNLDSQPDKSIPPKGNGNCCFEH